MDGAPDVHSDDFYVVLGVSKSASPDEIKRAYLALVREYTPERAPEVFKRIREAYETLSNPTTRGQYDTRPNPRITDLLNQAAEAMKAQDYSKAEQFYKQALLEAPGLDWVRNLLGICFLHQKRPLDAIAQYERVLLQPTVDASMHANLAHAYGMVRRYDDAEREFKIAMSLAGDRGFEYGLTLIEMIAERGEVDTADKLAQELIKAVPHGSAAASAYYSKQIELALRSNRRHTIPALLARMTRGLETEEQKRIAAGTLGNIGSRLIAGELFDVAERVAKTAGKLHPEDPGFDALEYAGRMLYLNDFPGIARLLRTHVSFAPGGALQGLKPWIEHYCATHAVYNGMRPLSSPPSFSKFYGIGSTVLGQRDYDEQTRSHVVTQYFTVFFIPLFPVANYRVRPAPTGGNYFLGRVPFRRAQKIHVSGFVGLIALWFVIGSLSEPATPGSALSSGLEPTPAPLTDTSTSLAAPVDAAALLRQTRYSGVLINITRTGRPVRAHIRLTFADLQAGGGGYLNVFPPLSGSGSCLLRARPDSVRLSVYSGSDTFNLVGARVADTIVGTYRMLGTASKREYGRWRAWLVGGTRIPARLDPW